MRVRVLWPALLLVLLTGCGVGPDSVPWQTPRVITQPPPAPYPTPTQTRPLDMLTPTVRDIPPRTIAQAPTPPPITAEVQVWAGYFAANYTNLLLTVEFRFGPYWTNREMLWGRFPPRKGIVHLAQGPQEVAMLGMLAEVWVRTPQGPLKASDIAVSPAEFQDLNHRVTAEESLWFHVEDPPPHRLWVRLRFQPPLAMDPWEGWVPVQINTGPGG